MYRVFDTGGRLLYVGSSERPRQRWHEHRSRTVWWPLARAYSLDWFEDRAAAYTAEARAIVAEQPELNQVWRPRPVPSPEATPEAWRVLDALRAIEQMDDPARQARAITEVLKVQSDSGPKLKEARRAWVLGQRAKKVTYREIAETLGVSISTVQDVERGYSGSGKNRPRTGRRMKSATGEPGGTVGTSVKSESVSGGEASSSD
ncbi:helix-turn-helix domain-containing protein [Streptomyces canarius]|uniref:helix-turn-helix domain-containing protein n=1 Tax=Streptomyces canarius TaxID=285453 RepID=UPI001E53022D|nr:helix-turn-helix domain-containing protein [Streptomyces canarius]